MITLTDLFMIKEAVASTALEHGWDAAKREEMFRETLDAMIKERMAQEKLTKSQLRRIRKEIGAE